MIPAAAVRSLVTSIGSRLVAAIALLASASASAAVVSATFNSATDVAVTAGSYTIAPTDVVVPALNFAPAVGAELMIVKNTGLSFINGTFNNLAQGQTVTLAYGGSVYTFVANYYGGSGNDLVLAWSDVARPFTWGGNNDQGALGTGSFSPIKSAVPVGVNKTGVLISRTAVAAAAGGLFSTSLTADGAIVSWGAGLFFQLGNGNTANSALPVFTDLSAVPAGERIVAISSGFRFGLALTAGGKVVAWGDNNQGQLGNGTFNGYDKPTQVFSSTTLAGKFVVAIAAGFEHSLALCSDGTLIGWGSNNARQLASDSFTGSATTPQAIGGGALTGKTVVAIAAGHSHSLALCSDGTVVAWGWDNAGQLGVGGTPSPFLRALPAAVTGGALVNKFVVAIAAGASHNVALCSDGTLVTWGANASGQLGNNGPIPSNLPVAINSFGVLPGKTIVGIAAGAAHTAALADDGTVAVWGGNFYGQLGDGSAVASSYVPVAVSMGPLGAGGRVVRIAGGSESNHLIALVAQPPPVPQMDVIGNQQVILPNDGTPVLADHTDFGDVTEAGNVTQTRTFTIRNTGGAVLNLTGSPDRVIISGGNTQGQGNDFTVTALPAASVPAYGTTTFDITFNPAALGLRTAVVSIQSNDTDTTPYVFVIQGTGTNPEIAVTGGGSAIPDGDTSPVGADGTDFGDVLANTSSSVHTFTITNSGSGTLQLGAFTTGSAEFVVTQPTPTAVAPGATATFGVTFTPTSGGPRTATLSIFSNDADENPYNFVLAGNGLAPEIAVSGLGQPIADGDTTADAADGTDFGSVLVNTLSSPRTFTIVNSGSATLHLGAFSTGSVEFVVSTPTPTSIAAGGTATFNVTFAPGATGLRTGMLSIVTDDPDENPYNFALAGNGTGPEVALTGLGTPIPDGVTTASSSDGTDFGAWLVGTSSTSHTFAIANSGTGALVLGTLTSSNAEFAVTQPTPNPVAPGGTATFTIVFTPTTVGTRMAVLSFGSNDADENPYTFTVQGVSLAPNASVSGAGFVIPDNDTSPISGDGTEFGSVLQFGSSSPHTFTVINNGSSPLTLGTLGTGSTEFTVTQPALTTLAPGASTTFTVTFSPTATGVRTATLTFATNDPVKNPYNFLLRGTSIAPEIDLIGAGNNPIPDGDTSPLVQDGTDFQALMVGSSQVHTFTIVNSGTTPLVLGTLTSSGPQFTVTQPSPTTIAAGGGTATFTVTYTPNAAGPHTATISLPSNDSDENAYDFSVTGSGVLMPILEVYYSFNIAPVSNGDFTPDLANGTDFGSHPVNGGFMPTPHYFTIRNVGNAPATITSINSVNSLEFPQVAASQPLAATLLPNGGSMFFNVFFDPNGPGLRTGTIEIGTNDPNVPLYTYGVQGNGTGDPDIKVEGGGANIATPDPVPSPNDATEFVSTVWNGAVTDTHTFTISNTGDAPLVLTGTPVVAVSGGPNSSAFTVTGPALTTIPVGGSTTFNVIFDPIATAVHRATLTIPNNDPDEGQFTFDVQGRGHAAVVPKPNIAVYGNTLLISPADITPDAADHTEFPNTGANNGATSSRTYTITNPGGAPLLISSVTAVGGNQGDFTVSGFTSGTIAPLGGTATFTVTFDPSAGGLRTTTIMIGSNVLSTPSYNFAVRGMGTLVALNLTEIAVFGNGLVPIVDGNATPYAGNGTYFGNVNKLFGSKINTYTISNQGFTGLTVGAITLSGGNALAGEFTVTQQPATFVPVGGSTTFKIKFDPSASGTRLTNVSFTNSDSNENPYNFTIRGTGTGAWFNGGTTYVWAGAVDGWLIRANVTEGPIAFDGDLTSLASVGTTRGFGWGGNDFGQLGNGTTATHLGPIAVDTSGVLGDLAIADLAAGQNHTVALSADGMLFAWGQGTSGQLGNGTLTSSNVPVAVNMGPFAGRTVVAIAAGQHHTLALCSDGAVFAWGQGTSGQLGNGALADSAVPVAVNLSGFTGRTAVALAAGAQHSVVLFNDGVVASWGANTYGQLGDGTTQTRSTPVPVIGFEVGAVAGAGGAAAGAAGAAGITAGAHHTIAAGKAGVVYAWGRNNFGQLGDGTKTDRSTPVSIAGAGPLSGQTLVLLSAGSAHTLALTREGTLFAWGANGFGQLGDGSTVDSSTPVRVGIDDLLKEGRTIIGLAAGANHGTVLTTGGTVNASGGAVNLFAWGANTAGQLGIGSTTSSARLTKVGQGTLTLSGAQTVRIAGGPLADRMFTVSAPPVPAIGTYTGGTTVNQGMAVGASDETNFGRVVAGTEATRTFVIANGGTITNNGTINDLVFSGTPRVVVGGEHAGDFTVISQPPASVPAGREVTFTVRFVPRGPGVRNATLTIASNDPVQPVFDFQIQGTGTTAGSIDPGLNASLDNTVRTAIVGPEGRILFGGAFTRYGSANLRRAGRFERDGSLDPTFGPNVNGNVNAAAIQWDGAILLGGTFTLVDDIARNRLVRLDANGAVDANFNPDVNGNINAILIEPDGRIVIAGDFTEVGGVAHARLARLNADGTLDAAFAPSVNRSVYTLARQPDGRLLIGGNFDTVNGAFPRQRLARLSAEGVLDTAFNPNASSDVDAIIVLPDGRFVVGGQFGEIGGEEHRNLARFSANGTIDSSFTPFADSAVYSLSLQADGKIIAGGHFLTINGVDRVRLARLETSGAVDLSFAPPPSPTFIDDTIYSTALQGDGRLVIAGAFIGVGELNRPFIARVDNELATQQLMVTSASRVVWMRGGTAPETLEVRFERSTDGGATWTALGVGSRGATGAWELTGLALSGEGLVRARARVPSGSYSGSSGLVETVVGYSFAAAPTIASQPQSITVGVGDTAILSVGATGTPAPYYQWMRVGPMGSISIPAANGPRLIIENVQASDAGSYEVLVSNSEGSLRSTVVIVSVNDAPSIAPTISAQPVKQTAVVGGSVTFTVVASGTPEPRYQWYRIGAMGIAPVPDATNSTLVLSNLQLGDSASYSVVITNGGGSVTSLAVPLIVTPVPVKPTITTDPVSKTVAAGGNVSFTVTATGTPAPSFQWRRNGGALTGATGATFTIPAVSVADAGSYDVIVSNIAGSVTSGAATLSVSTLPSIGLLPERLGAGLGTSVVLQAPVNGSGTFTYQWTKDGETLPNATGRTLPLGPLSADHAGVYRVAVTNLAGTVTSSPMALVVVDARGDHTVAGPGYVAGGTVTIVNRLAYGEATASLGWSVLLPDGWSFVSSTGNESAVKPKAGATNLLEWTWATLPASPVEFSYTLRVPAGTTGTHQLAALAVVRQRDALAQILAKPDPLPVERVSTHSADQDGNYRIELNELTRVIALYATYHGSVRTGAYRVLAGTEDGFDIDEARSPDTPTLLARHHSADTNYDGSLSLVELMRVIELYNHRQVTVRTGAYHPAAGTEDGFAPGP